jgi:hypothetical protein
MHLLSPTKTTACPLHQVTQTFCTKIDVRWPMASLKHYAL